MPKKPVRAPKSKRTKAHAKKSATPISKKKKPSAPPTHPRKRGLAGFLMHSNEELQTWVARIEDVCEELDELLIEAGDKPLDVNLASLDQLEHFLLDRYPTMDAALTLAERGVVDAASRHVGRCIQLATNGSKWALNLDDPDEVHYRLPVVKFTDGTNESPLTMITTSLSRRTGKFIRGLAEVLIEDYGG